MYLPRSLISHLYSHLLRTHHPLSPPVLILAALEPDALCACRILTALLKRDYIPHKIQPIGGYGDLARAGEQLVRPMQTTMGGSGGVVICMGVGGLVDLGEMLGLETEDDSGDMGGVEVWVIDARRPWNLGNVFGGYPERAAVDGTDALSSTRTAGVEKGRITEAYTPGKGGIIVYDDGDIEDDLSAQQEAFCSLEAMPEVDDNTDESDNSDSDGDLEEDHSGQSAKKRKSWSSREDEDSENEDERPRQRRRSNSVCPQRALLIRTNILCQGLIYIHAKPIFNVTTRFLAVITFALPSLRFPIPYTPKSSFSPYSQTTVDSAKTKT